MSGFAGIVGPISDLEKQWLDHAASFMAFRGPDAQSIWTGDQVGLAGRLLITDEAQQGHPVLASLDGVFWTVGDVRLDRRTDLQTRLGEPASANLSDLDLVLRAYRLWGESCLERLTGDFAFLLWDQRAHRLLGARDFPGTAQLYYAQAGPHWLFGNTYEAFFLHPAISDDLNEIAIGDFLVHGFNQDQATTVFSQIQRLPPGFILIWSEGAVHTRQFRAPLRHPDLLRLPVAADYPEAFREHLTRAVRDRLAPGSLSIHLSGGMDSTSVAATAVGLLGKPAAGSRLKAFTIELDGVADKQEGEYAQQVSDWLGLEREVLRAGSYPLRDPLVPEFVAPAPVPYLPTGVQRDLILRTASVGRVALTGQGGDGVLNFRASYWIEWVVTGKLLRLGTLTAEHLRLFGNPPELFPRAAWRGFRARDPVTIPRWISESFVRRTELRERNAPRVPPWRPDPDSTGFIGSAFWSDVLGWHDPEFTRLPLQFRHPFFDLELVEFAAGLPPVPWIHRKTVLRQAMQGLLPEAVLTRRKEVLDRVEGRTSHLGLHRNLPELFTGKAERFFDCAELAKACQETEITSWGMDSEFMSSIGLAYWLFHWRRPEPVRHPRPPVARRPEPGGRE